MFSFVFSFLQGQAGQANMVNFKSYKHTDKTKVCFWENETKGVLIYAPEKNIIAFQKCGDYYTTVFFQPNENKHIVFFDIKKKCFYFAFGPDKTEVYIFKIF